MSEKKQFLTEESKKAYIREFWDNLEPLVRKDIMSKKSIRTKFKIKEVPSPEVYGQKRIIELTHDKKYLEFSIFFKEWLWDDASVQAKYELLKTKNLVIPKRKIERGKNTHYIWRPGESNYWFIKFMGPVTKYIKAVELTPVDVGLFSTLEQAAKNLLK